ncbi:MAG: efflux RND transporter periplasmic adaptor subunit [Nitrospiraceae bacterium]|nr:MAG: efflux RND transporter periplasmic adaptor subunit [Nitrospiraceae bacterium]
MKYIIAVFVFLLAAGTAFLLYSTSPETRKTVPKRPVPLVETARISPGREKVIIEAFGTVVPANRIVLQPEVEGRIIDQNSELIPGGLIKQDDMVIQIDPSDYTLLVNQSKAELEEARFELDLEQGRQVIARREWKLIESEIDSSEAGKRLALREPHLELVKAKVDKAESRLAAAELQLTRTTVRSPFNALVLEEFIDRGQLVSRQTSLATFVGTDQFRVQVSVPVAVLPRIAVPVASRQQGSAVRVIFEPVSGAPVIRHGQVLRIMGDLDPEGRMARILIAIDDPLNLKAGSRNGKVLLGSYVKVMIDAGFFDDVYSVPRHALREGNVIWVMDKEDTLQIRPVAVLWRRKDDVLVNVDLREGERLILSRLQSPLPGMAVKNLNK